MSTVRKKPITGMVSHSGQRHSFHTTKKARQVSTTIVPVTAMP